MSPAAPTESTLPESSTVASSPSLVLPEGSTSDNLRFTDLRGVRWRIGLGILPSSSLSSVDDLRRVTADSRRRYAALRRRLLVDPQIPKDGSSSPDLVIDNPLSQSPDSVWGRFFRNAELERMVDQDLSRLYPEHGSYFQTPECQSMLRRILLLWCIVHLEYGYRQGMHELLAPLLYVLHSDVEHLSQVRKLYEDHFIDKFDGFTFHENDLTYSFDFKKLSNSTEDETASQKCPMKVSSLDELDPKIQDIVLLSDAYGAEGELGAVLSEKFMEHDTYCMFDALMSGAGGAVAMAEFFSPSPLGSSHTGLPPVIEASSALYHLLSIVDASLHSHLIELGVEPQYFALRWLRVLFGREFSLEDLLIIWDEIFASDNSKSNNCVDDAESSFGVLNSSRGAFISAVAVSMILYMRSSLLATEHATSCLQRLLNFPHDVNLKKIIGKAKSLQALAMDANNSKPLPLLTGALDRRKSDVVRGHNLSLGSVSPRTPLTFIPESYWEEKWRNLHKAEELTKSSLEKQVPDRKKGWSEKVRLNLSRTASTPTPSKVDSSKIGSKLSVRRSLLEDLSRQLGLEEDSEKIGGDEDFGQQDTSFTEVEEGGQGTTYNNFSCTVDERCLSGNAGSEENSSIFSESPSPNDHENQSARSSVASNLSIEVNDHESNNPESCGMHVEDSLLPVSDAPKDVFEKSGLNKDSIEETTATLDSPEDVFLKSGHNSVTMEKSMAPLKEQRKPSGKFQWFLKFGWNSGEGTSGKGLSETIKASNDGPRDQDNVAASSMVTGPHYSSPSGNVDSVDQNVMSTLRNLSQSMLENIQVII